MTKSNETAVAVAMLVMIAALAFPTSTAQAQRPDSCLGGTLTPPNPAGSDLVVKVDCTVGAGTYKFGNVNVLAGGVLRFADATIDFWAANILVENGGSLVAGSPAAPIGTQDLANVVTIHLYGKDQTGQNPNNRGTGIACLSDPARCGVPQVIWDSNVDSGTHQPKPPAQAVRIQTLLDGNPQLTYAGPVTYDYFYPYHPLLYDDANPQGYFGYKVLAVSYGGTLQLFGKKGATYGATTQCGETAPSTSGTSWARLNGAPTTNPTTLTLDRKVSLKKGDRVVVTTTDYLPGHSEQLTVSGDVACGTAVTVDETLQYAHSGTRYPLSTVPNIDPVLKSAGAETRAAVALLSRSIRIVSEGDTLSDGFPAESTGYFFGGHTIVRQGFKLVQIQGVEFYQLGQGGRLGHYPVHFHHARKTQNPPKSPDGTKDLPQAPPTFVADSSVWDSMTRWMVLHGTQDVTLARNVGYKSIGHGFYLEDGTEINNTLVANLGIFARAAVDNTQNPRKVPGILAAPDLYTIPISENFPYRSDYDHPTVFWIMNGWNDFHDNMAAGAGTCGACYWLVPGFNSTISRDQKWESYASLQGDATRAGTTPLKSFVGNSCTAAMTSFQTVSATEACQGLLSGPAPVGTFPMLPVINNPLAAKSGDLGFYPGVDPSGGRFPTQCGGPGADPYADCSNATRCSAGFPENCMVTVLDRYTTSFNWASFNFAAIWLRPQWYLVSNSVITDVQQAGLTMVTGGGYTASDVIPGHWALVQKSVFIGHTQERNPLASNGGPFNPQGLRCAQDASGNRPGNYCLSIAEGVSHQVSNFGMYQRLFSVYDGPAFQDSNAYLNITTRTMDDCTPFVDTVNKAGRCDPKNFDQGRQSAWLAGFVQGLPKAQPDPQNPAKDFCYMPNAAIGWKQPNGFFYPPAFHSDKLFFNNVDIRHFVISPLFDEGTLNTDIARVEKEYCIFNTQLFTGFAGNDRQTVLNDDDGSLTGYKGTTVINLDDFFAAPVEAIQCLSDQTSRTSPYQYVTSVVYPKCVIDGSCAKAPNPPPPQGDGNPNLNFGDWNRACTSESCYGVPLYRQDLMPITDKGIARSIRMMGQETGQRSTLTVNNGTYYLDTAVSKEAQLACTVAPCVINVFKENETYYLFLIFAKETTEQTYRFYVGDNTAFDPASIQMVQADIGPNPVLFQNFQPLPAGHARWLNNNKATAKGVVEVNLRVSDFPGVAAKYASARQKKCQPATYCTWNPSNETCVDASGSDAVCRWGIANQDCPDGGCIGIVFTLPAGFTTLANPATPRPAAVCLPKAPPWDVSLQAITVSDGVCPKASDTLAPDFCQ